MKKILMSFFLIILITLSSALSTLAATSTTIQEPDQGQVITVSHVSVVNVTTTAGTAPVLPGTVIATMSDGTTKMVNVNWATMELSRRTSAETFIVIGTIAESVTVKAIATVTVADVNPVAISTIQQVQQDILGTWKTSDERYTLEFHNDGTLEETELRDGYTTIYKDNYSFSNPNWIRIVNSSEAKDYNFVLNKNRLEIYNMGISYITGNSSYFSNQSNFINPTFSESSNSYNYVFRKVN
ncbi:Ig-like domain-containing protein [Desulfosporosinus sp. Sb-LF]|uniref:Ig-like domain-containing protein n=1 Tax=Desulfosporosinus sp. Sb-LF TaxID=2560027 RepID=UPI00107F041C|nr:Ig-like domain-containing protein [Desulfosporosinus sp. Sb-LF]TGE33807.1 hypothetical protein E4K68_03020 [Desulfosporosinus sp. Sb-LF]